MIKEIVAEVDEFTEKHGVKPIKIMMNPDSFCEAIREFYDILDSVLPVNEIRIAGLEIEINPKIKTYIVV